MSLLSITSGESRYNFSETSKPWTFNLISTLIRILGNTNHCLTALTSYSHSSGAVLTILVYLMYWGYLWVSNTSYQILDEEEEGWNITIFTKNVLSKMWLLSVKNVSYVFRIFEPHFNFCFNRWNVQSHHNSFLLAIRRVSLFIR